MQWLVLTFGVAALMGAVPAVARPVPVHGTAVAGGDRAMSGAAAYDYVVGTQTIGAAYQFTGQTKLVETAQVILGMGANTIKFALDADKNDAPPPKNLADVVREDASIKTVLGMPFANYLLWVYAKGVQGARFRPENCGVEYREMYDLTRVLLQTYGGTGKTFYLGNWEGDWHLLPGYDVKRVPTPTEIQNMIGWAAARQKAVDDAKRDTPHRGVQVYYYVEVNRVLDAMQGKVRLTNDVLPKVNPDFVSYSSYDSLGGDIAHTLPKSLDYIASQLSPKPGIPGRRVFIGEYGFPAVSHTPQEQDRLTREVMRAGLTWGCPFVLYWEMFNNEVTPDGKQRGFWLIDDHGVKQPVYETHRLFYQRARRYVADFQAKNHRLPTRDEFGVAAAAWLNDLPPPPLADASVLGPGQTDPLNDLSKTAGHTAGMSLDSSNPGFFDGDTSRLRRGSADTPQSVLYKFSGVSGFLVTAYVFGGFDTLRGPKVRLYVSPNGTRFEEVPVAHAAPVATRSGWFRVMLKPKEPLPGGTMFLKIELANDPTVYSPQVAQVALTGPGVAPAL